MKATCFSKEPYFPMLLANGADAVTVGFGGSPYYSLSNHAHNEQYQGCTPGWYKVAHRSKVCPIQPCVQSGYHLFFDGEACDITEYTQSFDPEHAVLTTEVELSVSGGRCEITSFLTDDHIFVQRFRILKKGQGKLALAFYLHPPGSWMSVAELRDKPELLTHHNKDGSLGIRYTFEKQGIKGIGQLFSDRQPSGYMDDFPGFAGAICFNNLKEGWTGTKYLTIADTTDGKNYKKNLKERVEKTRKKSYNAILKQHSKIWADYSSCSRVTLPDEKFQYLYDLSVYCLRANQHPETGAITVGMLPHLWAGGVNVPYDAWYAHQALLQTNRLTQAQSHLNFYHRQRPAGKKLAKKFELPGAAYSGWCNYFGQDLTENIEHRILYVKPLMSAFIVLEHYWQWIYDPENKAHPKHLLVMKEILDLAIQRFIDDQGNEAVIKPCMAGNESHLEVENDTYTSLLYARSLAGYVEMARGLGKKVDPYYDELLRKMYRGLEKNYEEDVLLPYRHAKYLTTAQPTFFLFNLPEGINARSIDVALKDAITPWGLDSYQPSEAYRDWPWLSSRVAIVLAHLGNSKKSFRWLKHAGKYVSALGAIPEKIRMDGYPIGYWYSTPHALFIWSVTAALAHEGKDGSVRLFWGLDGSWKDFSFDNLKLPGGLTVSAKVENDVVKKLRIINPAGKPANVKLDINPKYSYKGTW